MLLFLTTAGKLLTNTCKINYTAIDVMTMLSIELDLKSPNCTSFLHHELFLPSPQIFWTWKFPDCSFAFHILTSLSKNIQKHSNHSYTNILKKKNNPEILPAFKTKLCGFLFRRWKHRLADPMLKRLSQFGMFVKPPSTSCHQLRKDKNSSGDDIANVNFLYDDTLHAF